MAKTDFIAMLREQGLVDERNAGVIAMCQGPGGYGMGLACVKGGTLRIYETWYNGKPGPLIDEIELKEIRDLKGSAFLLHSYLKFRCRGQRYLLKNFGGARNFLAAVREEAAQA